MKENIKAIDIHIHGGFGINFDNANQNDYMDFLSQAYTSGLYAICPALTGDVPDRIYEKLSIIKEIKQKTDKMRNITKIIGANLEGTFLDKNKPGIQNKDYFLKPDKSNFIDLVKDSEDIVKIVTIGEKDNNDLVNYLKSKNIKVHFGHTTMNEIKNADGITHLFNAMDDISHKKETLCLSALLDKNIYIELIADTKHVIPDLLKLTFKIKDLNKIILISDAIPLAKSNLDYITFCGKKIYKGGVDDKGTLAGSVMFLPDIIQNLDKTGILPIEVSKKLVYENVVDYLKLIV